MTLYYYNKYSVNQVATQGAQTTVTRIAIDNEESAYQQMSWNSTTGYVLTNYIFNIYHANLIGYYDKGFDWIANFGQRISTSETESTYLMNVYYYTITKSRGTFISTIIGTETQYPVDGESSGYWYIRQGLAETATLTTPVGGEIWDTTHTLNWTKSDSGVNVDIELSLNNGSTWKRIASNNTLLTMTYNFANEIETTNAKIRIRTVDGVAVGVWFTSGTFTILHNVVPTKPPTLNIPALKSSENAIITWGASYDADGDIIKYYLERAINGGSYAIILNGLSVLTHTDSILTTYNTVKYRVRAYDDTAYSIYNESTLRTVQHFPDFKMKIGGVLKSSDSGWVKINGELKQISTITIKDNGVLKEV